VNELQAGQHLCLRTPGKTPREVVVLGGGLVWPGVVWVADVDADADAKLVSTDWLSAMVEA
jgi:hypothetical protein